MSGANSSIVRARGVNTRERLTRERGASEDTLSQALRARVCGGK